MDDLSALDPGGHIDRVAGLVQRRGYPSTRIHGHLRSSRAPEPGPDPAPRAAGIGGVNAAISRATLMITMLGAGLSQVDLASRASVTQSVISAYESGQRQPSLPALARLIEADGFELTLGLRRQPGRLRRLSGPVGRRVRRHREDLIAAADLKPGVRERVESDLIAL